MVRPLIPIVCVFAGISAVLLGFQNCSGKFAASQGDVNSAGSNQNSNCNPGALPFGGGTGAENDPYLICAIKHLEAVGSKESYLSQSFRLESDLDATGSQIGMIGLAAAGGVVPFSGNFDGNGKSVSNFSFAFPAAPVVQYVGLFSALSGRVSNLNLVNINLASPGSYSGLLVGQVQSSGRVINCSVSGSIAAGATGTRYVGGLVGDNNGTIENSSANMNIVGSEYTGGLVGSNQGTIYKSATRGTVKGSRYWGGLAGRNNGNINECSSSAEVSPAGSSVNASDAGGLVGYSESGNSSITKSFATGNVSGGAYVGGFIGYTGGTISKSYATGTVTGSQSYQGGFAGNIAEVGSVSESYSTGGVSGTSYVGGFSGSNSGTITKSYSTGSTQGAGNYSGGFTGSNAGVISKSYSTGSAQASQYAGGFAGETQADSTISDSYAKGNAAAVRYSGGFVGSNSGSISRAYSIGQASATSNMNAGGFSSDPQNSTVVNVFWDTSTSGLLLSAGGTGQSTALMKSASTYTGWDFVTVWSINAGEYPALR